MNTKNGRKILGESNPEIPKLAEEIRQLQILWEAELALRDMAQSAFVKHANTAAKLLIGIDEKMLYLKQLQEDEL